MEEQIQSVTGVVDAIIDFGVTYGFQLFGAIVFLVIGLKLAGWAGGQPAKFAEARNLDQTLARFFGNVVKVVLVVFVAAITLGNFGIAIAPLIALAGASAFGATLALRRISKNTHRPWPHGPANRERRWTAPIWGGSILGRKTGAETQNTDQTSRSRPNEHGSQRRPCQNRPNVNRSPRSTSYLGNVGYKKRVFNKCN